MPGNRVSTGVTVTACGDAQRRPGVMPGNRIGPPLLGSVHLYALNEGRA